MHVVLFQMKRAYHATLKLGRRILREFGLTPARFDLLWVVMRRWWHYGSKRAEGNGRRVIQSQIRRELGVSAPTVSRMLKSLDQLGLVRRVEAGYDRRKHYVHPTTRCRRLMTMIAGLTLRNGFSDLMVRSIFVPERWFSKTMTDSILERLLQRFRALRNWLEDRVDSWNDRELYTDRTHADWWSTRDLQAPPGLPYRHYLELERT